MSCNIARRAKKVFHSKKLKSSYHYDTTDPKNLKFPLNIDKISDDTLHNIVSKIVEKYKQLDYKDLDREQLEEKKEWNDLVLLFLIKFYQKDWSINIDNEEDFFPHFVFTFNPEPLKKKIDNIISYCYDHIELEITKEDLENKFSWSALDVTYLLHYFVIAHPEYKEDIN